MVEGDSAAQGAVVEEDNDLAPARQPHEIGFCRVYWFASLPGRQHGVAHASSGGDIERFQIDGGLGEPHALRWMTKAMGEVGQPPMNLGLFVAERGERKDGVVVCLCEGIADAVPFTMTPVRVHDALVYVGMMRFEPSGERGAEIEADALEDACRCVGAV